MLNILQMFAKLTKPPRLCFDGQRSVHYLRSRLMIPNHAVTKSNSAAENAPSSRESKCVSWNILEKNGFLTDSQTAGLLTLLPLGMRTLNKLTNLIRSELNKIQCQEIEMPSLCDLSLWSKTGRAELMGHELFHLEDRHSKKLCLNPTHEEVVTSLVAKFAKELTTSVLGATATSSDTSNSLRLYQITRKYRDESRPKHGLLRAREFLMKDLYTFHTSDACAEETYKEVCKAYEAIFEALCLKYVKVNASSGSMGGSKSNEYHVRSPIGEDAFHTCEKCGTSVSDEFIEQNVSKSHKCQNTGIENTKESLVTARGIEIGHTFLLGDRYTKQIPIELHGKVNVKMGCYGIGVTRLMQVCVENMQTDNRYPNWPVEIAPFRIAILPAKLGSKEEEKSGQLVKYLCNMLESHPLFADDVLVDDRTKLSIGSRILDAKLLGIPYVVVLGKAIAQDNVEILINSELLQKALKKNSLECHTRELAHVLKHLNDEWLYSKKEAKLSSYLNINQ